MMSKETSKKEWWKIARSQMGPMKTKSIDSILNGDILVSNDEEMSNVLNNYFIKEATLEEADVGLNYEEINLINENITLEVLENFIIYPGEIEKIIKKTAS